MSRSYKHFPLFRDNLWGKSMKKGKQYANRKIRRKLKDCSIDVGTGNYYRSFGLDSWDLWEYKSYQTKQDVIDNWEQAQKRYANGVPCYRRYKSTLEEELNWWASSYLRK